MELQKIKSRTYLIKNEDERKMIPKKYHNVAKEAASVYNFSKVFLNNEERFMLELCLLKKNIEKEEPYVFELIKNEAPAEVAFVTCKFNENRYEIKLGKYNVKCSIHLYTYASKNLKNERFSNY